MNTYLGLEALLQLHTEELNREAERARLAAMVGRNAGPGYRQRLAASLRAFARRIDPTCEPAARIALRQA